eukprot:COSAG02_NODE_5978_length_3898_cov_1.338510_2_plen_71_part_00
MQPYFVHFRAQPCAHVRKVVYAAAPGSLLFAHQQLPATFHSVIVSLAVQERHFLGALLFSFVGGTSTRYC